ncbi:hypothetical protein TNCV_2697531 [Trichonephila clavipes]|nr:hypothetical protein TNCV_2697531 [Trichonephila clavipes]
MTHLQLSRCSETQDQCWQRPEGPVQRQNGGLFVPGTTTWVRITQPLGSCSNLHTKLHVQNLYSLQPLLQSPALCRTTIYHIQISHPLNISCTPSSLEPAKTLLTLRR